MNKNKNMIIPEAPPTNLTDAESQRWRKYFDIETCGKKKLIMKYTLLLRMYWLHLKCLI
jgi:hypothetical protein